MLYIIKQFSWKRKKEIEITVSKEMLTNYFFIVETVNRRIPEARIPFET